METKTLAEFACRSTFRYS